ncbi:hypothetical protein JXD38_08860 [candidate division WOR-3 bacterium]|nr:hypothetical protein [candidate division WOR-3 bacterium]
MVSDDVLMRKVKQVCVAHGASAISLNGYRSFALQVDKTRKQVSGHDLELVAGALVERYVKLGLDGKALRDIVYKVFNVRVPNHE